MVRNLNDYTQDFPILKERINDERLVYLDSAATSQKPQQLLDALSHYYLHDNANVHRGVHTLAQRATDDFEDARQKVADFIHAKSASEVLFTKGTTQSLNWVAQSMINELHPGDEILISLMEHHSNLVPWQQLAVKTGAALKFITLTPDGQLDTKSMITQLTNKTRVLALTHVSNVLGTINPVELITEKAHEVGAVVVIDGAQAVPHFAVDMQQMNCDFYAFSGHKMCGPTGIGVLYAKKARLSEMEPLEFGGEMIDTVTQQTSTWADLPWKFEAGTPNIAGAIGLGAAIDYLQQIGMDEILKHEQVLMAETLPRLQAIDGVQVFGPKNLAIHSGVLSFNVSNLHPHDLATALDMQGIAIRAGHHCAQPLMTSLGQTATARASFYFYNTLEDVDALIDGIQAAKEFFNDGTV